MRSILVLLLSLLLVVPNPAASDTTSKPKEPKDFDNGFKVALEVMKEMRTDEDAAQLRRVNEIGYRVAQKASPDMPFYSFRIVKMEEPNAFALPGGFIFVSTGMLELDLTDDELAALLGHEIIHVKNEHSRKMSKRQTIMNLLYQALVIGIAFGLKDNQKYDPVTGLPTRSSKAEVLQGSAAFGLVFQELLLRGFNRELELESDHEGMIASSRAGFDPQGTSQLFEKMRQRIYEAPGYGYWRTHPYLEDRMEEARVLAATMEAAKNPADATNYRIRTQETFLQVMKDRKEEEEKTVLRRMALNAYNKGKTADELRWWFIRDAEMKERDKEPFYRDYGKLLKLYEENISEIKDQKETSEMLPKLEKNLATLRVDITEAMPMYEEVLQKEMFDTEMLQRFLSNFPESPRTEEVKYRLAENYRILKKSKESVDLFLEILAGGDSIWKERSRQSLLNLVPTLDDLSACYAISAQASDQHLILAAEDRMASLSGTFSSLQNGYEFRRKYPTSDYEKPVREKMAKLATDTLQQAKLYQAVGEYQKALDHYNKILRYCSDLPVADQVKDSIVDFQEVKSVRSSLGF